MNPFKAGAILGEIFREAREHPTLKDDPDKMAGLELYIGVLKNLPFEKLLETEEATAREIKKRIEIRRQKLDQGNIDKAIEGAFK